MDTQTSPEFISESGKSIKVKDAAGAFPAAKWENQLAHKFIHHVFFWLKQPGNAEDKKQLMAGLKKLSAAKSIRMSHIGIPAGTNREVIDTSYAVSWLLVFDNPEDQESYQTDPIHLKFIEDCSMLWERVVVYDVVEEA